MFHIVIGIDNANPTENTSMSVGQVVLGTKQNRTFIFSDMNIIKQFLVMINKIN